MCGRRRGKALLPLLDDNDDDDDDDEDDTSFVFAALALRPPPVDESESAPSFKAANHNDNRKIIR